MNTNNLKRFAQETRRKLLEQVGARLSFVLTTDSAVLREKADQIKQLREELNKTSKVELIEKVAYTWFNRLMALRFMDTNDYQPLGIRVITPKDDYSIPEILDEAKKGNIPEELKINRKKVFDLLDNRIPSSNPQNEAFKELIIAACNHLHTVLPFLFEKINDYTELLLPDDFTSDFSIVTDVREGMPVEDCKNVEIIGWLYQFYISEKKEEVIGSKVKVKKEDIPAATQLFTPRWIVEYMVQNTLGKLWLNNRPKSKLKEHMQYFIESEAMKSDDYIKINSPEEIKFLDPASGSGHILVYAFDLFTKIYEEEGYNSNDIPKLIIEKNIYGFEIDERAAQLSGLSLMMKAREYQRRVLRNNLKPNILCFQDLKLTNIEIKDTLDAIHLNVSDELMHDLLQMQNATNFGSLIFPHASLNEIIQMLERFNQASYSSVFFQRNAFNLIESALSQLKTLSTKFHCLAANPPYMGGGNMNKELSEWVKTNYIKAKADFFSCFIERSLNFVPECGYCGLVTMESWMFLSSFEDFRKGLLQNIKIHSLSHFGWHIMRIAFGTVSFILQNAKPDDAFKGIYSYLEIEDIDKHFERPRVFPKMDNGRYKIARQKDFEKIPSSPIGYWASKTLLGLFNDSKELISISRPCQGMATTNNQLFVRDWFEVEFKKVNFYTTDISETYNRDYKWYPYNKGGSYRRWYGNHEDVVNFENGGKSICNYIDNTPNVNMKSVSRVINRERYFKSCISWSKISSGIISMRFYPIGFTFDVAGCSIFGEEKFLYRLLGFVNSNLAIDIFSIFSPTLNYEVGQVNRLPIHNNLIVRNEFLEREVKTIISIYKEDWDIQETSWGFKTNQIEKNFEISLPESIDYLQTKITKRYNSAYTIENNINKEVYKLYEIEFDEKIAIKPKDISLIYQPDKISINLLLNELISYAVGCMFGRFSLDKEGLILANHGETIQDYLQKICKFKSDASFLPDDDNIIPILEDGWFEDDITTRFYKFLKVTFGDKNFNKNLSFLEEKLGKNIRKFFTKDFYPDHIKRYKKRPIYWMFSSPKGTFNVLIYMHRYTPDTINTILNKYLREFIAKLKTRKEHLNHIVEVGSATEKTKAIKEMDSIEKTLMELRDYERDILYPMAIERIPIDLDDGVLVNYNKFGKAVKEVPGLNDKKTKEAVKKFDWIDTTLIR